MQGERWSEKCMRWRETWRGINSWNILEWPQYSVNCSVFSWVEKVGAKEGEKYEGEETRSNLPMILFTTVHVLWLRSVCLYTVSLPWPPNSDVTYKFTWSINKGECSIHRKGFPPSGICSSLSHILLLMDNSDYSVYLCSNLQFAYRHSPVLPTSENTVQLPAE